MKVLILSHMYPYNLEPTFGLFVHEQVKESAKRCEVVVASPSPLAPPLIRQFKARWMRYALKPKQTQLEGIQVYYPRYLNIPGARGFPLSAFFYYWAMKGFLAKLRDHFDFDLIHTHAICPDGWAATHLGRPMHVPVICTIHGADVNIYPQRTRLTHFITRQGIREVDYLITVSAALKEKTLALETPKRDIRVIPNGVDLEKFVPMDKQQARAELGLPQDKPILIYASRLDPAKGLSYLLLAFKTVLEQRPRALLFIIGEGSYKRHLQQEIAGLGIKDSVFLTGLRPHPEIAAWMSAGDLVVQPSFNEGSPLPVYEALVCGRPIIASRVGGIPELIANDNYGLLVPPANTEALAETLLQGLGKTWDPELIKNYGRQFTWTRVADQLLNFYGRVLANQSESSVAYKMRYEQL